MCVCVGCLCPLGQVELGCAMVGDSGVPSSRSCSLMEEGGDWDRKNRLKIYEGLYALSTRNFTVAATNFFDTMATFTCSEAMSYHAFVKYAVFACMVAMDRGFVKEKVSRALPAARAHCGSLCEHFVLCCLVQIIGGAEVLEVLHSHKELGTFVHSLYNCQYDVFFKMLGECVL